MIAEIDEFRHLLSQFVELLANVLSEAGKAENQPDSIGFCTQANRVFTRHLHEIDEGLSDKKVDLIVHAILLVDSDVEMFTEYDLTWSTLWRRSDLRERLGLSASHLIKTIRVVKRKPEILAELLSGK